MLTGCLLLSPLLFVLNIREVLCGALPSGIEDEALIVLGLAQDARPGVEEGGCISDRS